jgi:maltose alpha-D-glucosyltransferase/alpha-amylase
LRGIAGHLDYLAWLGVTAEILHDAYPLVYVRGGQFLVVVNPSGRATVVAHGRPSLTAAAAVKHAGVEVSEQEITAGLFSFGIFRLQAG